MRKFVAIYILILLSLILLAACSPQRLGESTGPVFVLNAEHWTPTPADLAVGADADHE